jgi:hypothetical protein
MLNLSQIYPRILNDHVVRLADEDDDLATICNLFRAHRVLPTLGYRGIGMGFEGAIGLYLCNASSVPETVHHLGESDAARRPGVYAYMRSAQTSPEEIEAFFSSQIVYRYIQSLLAVLRVGEERRTT